MNLDEYLNLIDAVRAEIIDTRADRALLVSNLFLAILKDRIQREGKNSDGAQFMPYTTPYKKKREKGGYQTGYVDFTVTGRMWANITPQAEIPSPGVAEVVIKARDQENQDKLNGQFKKRGNILTATEEEIDFINQREQAEFNKIISKL